MLQMLHKANPTANRDDAKMSSNGYGPFGMLVEYTQGINCGNK